VLTEPPASVGPALRFASGPPLFRCLPIRLQHYPSDRGLLGRGGRVSDDRLFGPLSVERETGAFEPWGRCTYRAIEKRPDVLTAVQDHDAGLRLDLRERPETLDSQLDTPLVGDLAVWAPGVGGAGATTGHVAYVESVESDGSFVVSE
jgi:hypothetical protein